ncbi:MAG: cell division protein FtsL [Deltaproteobacteria bacterium]|nr:cell division protein FtsL [Deltaproteobacteria bacterium]
MTRPDSLSKMMNSRNATSGVRMNNAKAKPSRFHVSRRQVVITLMMLICFMGTGIGYVWSNFERTQIGYNLSQLQKEEMRLSEINQKLKLELATLKSPQNLEHLAIQKLGLGPPKPEQIILLP